MKGHKTMMTTNGGNLPDDLAHLGDIDTHIERVDVKAVAVLNRSEIECQLDAAHKYPRQIKRFLNEAITLATLTRDVAESCIYALPRGGKTIAGPSVRLAEICASAYGNLHIGARVIDAEDKEVVAQGVAWDLEKNLRVTVEARRRITNKAGRRYDDDMVTVTGAAAGSIALRNAIFRVVPRAYVDTIYAKVREVAVGNANTLAARRSEVVARLQKIGVPIERIFARVGKAAIEDVGLEELEILIGLGTAIKNSERSIDDAFPEPDTTAAKTKDLERELTQGAAKMPPTSAPEPAKATRAKKAPPPAAEPVKVNATPSGTDTFNESWKDAPEDPARDDAGAEEHFGREPGED